MRPKASNLSSPGWNEVEERSDEIEWNPGLGIKID